MTAPKKKPSEPAKPKASDNVKANIRRQRTRPAGTAPGDTIGEAGRIAALHRAYEAFKRDGIPISAPDLARLAMARNGTTKDLATISDESLDDLLQFVARCQWRLEVTKELWGAYAAAFVADDLGKEEPSDLVKGIREECAPVTFERSMILLGSPVRAKEANESATDARARNFFPIFKAWFIGGHRLSYLSSGEGLEEGKPWAEPKNQQIRAAWETRQREGWPDLHVLEGLARYAEAWRKRRRTESARTNASKPRNRKPS
jgi:hypothetical protein